MLLKINSISDASIIHKALKALVNECRNELSEITVGSINAVQIDKERSDTINNASRLQLEIENQLIQ